MTISDNPGIITKGLEDTYVLQFIKGTFYKDSIYLEATVEEYYVSKYVGGNYGEMYPCLSA